jgi:hypothetical protein
MSILAHLLLSSLILPSAIITPLVRVRREVLTQENNRYGLLGLLKVVVGATWELDSLDPRGINMLIPGKLLGIRSTNKTEMT